MFKKLFALAIIMLLCKQAGAQAAVQDSIYLMNGNVVGEKVIDTLLGAVSIKNPKKQAKLIHFEYEQLYMVRFSNGLKRYYYRQDSLIGNIFTRDEMYLYTKGENDARRGFKARGALVTGAVMGLAGGLTGTFWGPILPYGFMALSGITKIKIKHETISDPRFVESDAYILGYERVARQKRKTKALIGGTAGLILGYSIFAIIRAINPNVY